MKRSRYDLDLPEDAGAPGGVYLCQVSERVSCAACCGVYNDRNLQPERLRLQLIERTRIFAGVRRDVEAIDAFGRSTLGREKRLPKFADFHSCPFVGLVGKAHNRVGCLLHPCAENNGGVDYRGLSYYGGMACRRYFCPSYRRLPAGMKTILRAAALDWFEYGLLITETELLQACFEALRRRVGAEITPERFFRKPENPQRLRALVSLKIHWPYRGGHEPGPCNYFFEDGRHPGAGVRYPVYDHRRSPHHVLFKALGSEFDDRRALRQAEALLEDRIEALAGGLR
jgi:hypothetical protein